MDGRDECAEQDSTSFGTSESDFVQNRMMLAAIDEVKGHEEE